MEIRIATVDDVNDLYELNALFCNEATIESMRRALVENTSEMTYIAFEDGYAVGFCTGYIARSICYIGERAEIEGLFVQEACRGRGVGKALILALVRAFEARGIEHFHISTGADNAVALALYEGIGFERSGVLLERDSLGD